MGGLLASPPAGAGEPIPSVRVLDEETGQELEPRGLRRSGDVLLVYCRGYDLRRVALEPAAGAVTVRLRRARTCTVRLPAGDYAPVPVTVAMEMPASQPSPLRDRYEVALEAGGRLEVAVPAGARSFVVVRDGSHYCAWPRAFWLEAGGEYEVHIELPRQLRLRRDGSLPRVRTAGVAILADLLWTPRCEPARVDAWRAATVGGAWLAGEFRAAGASMRVLPNVPFHFFAVLDGQPVYRYVRRGDEVLDLRRPFETRAVARRPLVDGRPVPAGTLLAPGRLDMYAVQELWDQRAMARCAYRTRRADEEEWPEVRLPPSPWLTIWHEDFGLAHAAWRRGATPTGRTYPGQFTVTVPEGVTATGYVAACPTWKGTGEWSFTPVEAYLRRRFEGRRSVRFPGLRPGPYAFDLGVTLTEIATGRTVRLQQAREISVTEENLSPVYRLPAP